MILLLMSNGHRGCNLSIYLVLFYGYIVKSFNFALIKDVEVKRKNDVFCKNCPMRTLNLFFSLAFSISWEKDRPSVINEERNRLYCLFQNKNGEYLFMNSHNEKKEEKVNRKKERKKKNETKREERRITQVHFFSF